MPIYLIDTSAWIFTLGHHPMESIRKRVRDLVEQNIAAVTSPILFELLSGVRDEVSFRKLQTYLLSLHPFPFTPDEWLESADWTRSLRKKGLTIKTLDALIAYKAIRHGLTLLHADRDFDRIAVESTLKTESYVDAVHRVTKNPAE